jgi:pimeloyl-ACP methyl ester carboxylesterase
MTGTTTPANPAAAFYAASRVAQGLGFALRAIDSLAPALGTRAALRLFFTPLPWKFAMRRPVPAPWAVQRWPFEGAEMAVYRRSDVEPGRPIVLLAHGWAGGGLQMRAIGDALAHAGLDPVLLDFPGHGRSGGWRSTLPQFTRAIYAAASRLGPLHGLVAHSLGALAAMHTTARGLPVDRLVLLAPSAPPALFLRWFAGSFGLNPTVPERMRDRIEVVEGVPLNQFEPDWLGERIGQRTLLVHDEGDKVSPLASSHRIVRALPNAALHTTTGLGHTRVLGDAEVIVRVLKHVLPESADTSGRRK